MRVSRPGSARWSLSVARFYPALLDVAAELGVDRDDLLEEAGFFDSQPEWSDRPPAAALGLLIDAAQRRTGDDAFMLRVASAVTRGSCGIVVRLAYSCELLADAFSVLGRHFGLFCDFVIPDATCDETTCTVAFELAPEASCMSHGARRGLKEAAAAIMLLHLRRAVELHLVPTEVSFRHERRDDLTEHRRLFGIEPHYGAQRSALRFPPETHALPCANPDPELCAVLKPYAELVLARGYRDAPWTRRALEAISAVLARGEPRIEDVASRLHLSLRSLQRRLREEGTSFTDIVDSVRHAMAINYLSQPELSASDIAYRLGFADVSSFHRAFRRWTGQTVSLFRQQR